MSSFDDADERFVNMLLASTRHDAQPDDVEGAWVRFAGSLQGIGLPGRGERAGERTSFHAEAPVRGATAAPSLHRLAAFNWWVLGVVAGGGAMGVVLLRHRSAPAGDITTRAPSDRAPTPVAAPATPDIGAAPGEHRPVTWIADTRRPRKAHSTLARAVDRVPPPGARLAAEVARIDTARTVSAMGDHDEAIALVERYHRDFPDGALAADAEVVALEALAAKHDAAETMRRAALFLTRHPNDPHAARVRWLAQHASD